MRNFPPLKLIELRIVLSLRCDAFLQVLNHYNLFTRSFSSFFFSLEVWAHSLLPVHNYLYKYFVEENKWKIFFFSRCVERLAAFILRDCKVTPTAGDRELTRSYKINSQNLQGLTM